MATIITTTAIKTGKIFTEHNQSRFRQDVKGHTCWKNRNVSRSLQWKLENGVNISTPYSSTQEFPTPSPSESCHWQSPPPEKPTHLSKKEKSTAITPAFPHLTSPPFLLWQTMQPVHPQGPKICMSAEKKLPKRRTWHTQTHIWQPALDKPC